MICFPEQFDLLLIHGSVMSPGSVLRMMNQDKAPQDVGAHLSLMMKFRLSTLIGYMIILTREY